MESIILALSHDKAIAFDGLSDVMFKKELAKLTSSKLKDIWSINLDEVAGLKKSWVLRLIPLNKVFPETPTRTQLRPIVISSPLIKLLEARFLEKLKIYLNEKLDRSQTGFVDKMGIQVNLHRALKQITNRFKNGNSCFGLFIDFSNAYNSVPHTLLFQKLRQKQIFTEEEVQFLEALYARYRIKIGKKYIRSNKGVAQGSIISPALFNIFIEDLSDQLKEEAGISLEDLLFYADDLLTLCDTQEQLAKCIQVIEKWSKDNGMLLNKKKSAIVIFSSRRKRKIPDLGEQLLGIPIIKQYKYLGTILDSKLTLGPQMKHIKKKVGHLFVQLYPYLKTATADARRDMWQTMTAPLFNATLALHHFEPSKYGKENIRRLWRMTFKRFLMISHRNSTVLVDELMNRDITTITTKNARIAEHKWKYRKGDIDYEQIYEQDPDKQEENTLQKLNPIKGVPNNFCTLLKTQVRVCPKHPQKITSSWHMKYYHGCYIKPVSQIWQDDIKPLVDPNLRRDQIAASLTDLIDRYINIHNNYLSSL